jgi:homoaconitase/3-isopropylmalate dehydratase large subunit
LYKQTDTFPRSAKLHLYPAATFDLANAVQTATQLLGRSYCTIEHTPAGGSQKSWSALIEGVEHVVTPETWQATLLFTSGDRWTAAYGTTGLFTLGTSSWGGTEILAP